MAVKDPTIGKCIICGDEIYKSEKSITSKEGMCHQRCVYSTPGLAQA